MSCWLCGLALRDTWFSPFVLLLSLIIVLSPLVLAMYEGVIPSTYGVSGQLASGGDTLSSASFTCESFVVGTTGEFNVSMFWRVYGGFLGHLSVLYFVLAGMIVIFVVARPLEMKYFFVELTFTGSRVKLLLGRLIAAISLMLVSSAASALGLASVLYVMLFPGGWWEAFKLALLLSASSVLLSVPVATLLSLVSRSSTVSVLGFLGFVALCLVAGSKIDLAESLVNVAMIVRGDPVGWVSLLLQFLFFVLGLMGVERVEY